MNEVAVGFGIFLLIVGLIVAFAAAYGIWIKIPPTTYFARIYMVFLEEAVIAIALMVAGGILIFWGIKKR